MEFRVLVAYTFGLALVYVIARVLVVPVRILWRLLYSALVGALLLLLVNLVGRYLLGIYLPVNPVTVLVAGFLGIPGVVLLIALQLFLL